MIISRSTHVTVNDIILLLIFKWLSSIQLQASLLAQKVKNLPAMRETWVKSLGWEDPLEEEMATHSSTLTWEIPWTEEPGGLHGITKELDMT